MPVYEYRCGQCGNRFDLLRRMAQADESVACPECQADGARRVLSIFASFSKTADGSTRATAGSDGGCASCSSSSCAGCTAK